MDSLIGRYAICHHRHITFLIYNDKHTEAQRRNVESVEDRGDLRLLRYVDGESPQHAVEVHKRIPAFSTMQTHTHRHISHFHHRLTQSMNGVRKSFSYTAKRGAERRHFRTINRIE